MKKQAEEWVKYAKIDLQAAKALLEEEDHAAIAAFHVQQCVEK